MYVWWLGLDGSKNFIDEEWLKRICRGGLAVKFWRCGEYQWLIMSIFIFDFDII